MFPLRRTLTQMSVAAGLLVLGAAGHAQTWWNADYAKRIPVTITNPAGGLQPTANQTAEVWVDPLPADARGDYQDLRVVYQSGATATQLDRQVIREAATAVFENTNVGNTDYNTLPTGTKLTSLDGQDDTATVITLPFAFPFQGTTSNKLTVATDGYVKPGETEYNPRPSGVGNAGTINAIIPFSSDFAVTDAAAGVWADTSDPTKVTIRWEVNESASGPVIAKFALILYPNGDARFVYGTPASSPATGIAGPGSYWPVVYGFAVGSGASVINAPTWPVDFANHADILYTQNLSGSNTAARVVFRLVNPLAEGATSSGEYFIYYGNPSPTISIPTNIRNIYDHIVDSQGETVGQPAADWLPLRTGTATTEVVNGITSAVLRNTTSGVSHPRYIVKPEAVPNFLNAELYTQFTPLGGENEIVPLLRVPNTLTNSYPDPNRAYGGGVGYATDGWGSQQGLASVINPEVDQGPADFAGLTPNNGQNPTGVIQNVLFRYEGQLLWGKKWSQFQAQPDWVRAAIDRTAYDPQHGGVSDPIYDQPGGTGIASYSTSLAVHFIALRELITESTTAVVVSNTATGPFIQGTIASTNATLNPLTGATIRVTGPGGFDESYVVGPDGQYRISLPAGTGPYTVAATAAYHTDASVQASPTASGLTNITLTYVGARISGLLRDGLTLQPAANAKVTVTDANGLYVHSTTANAAGEYSLLVPTGGTYHVNWYSPRGIGTTAGVPRQVTVASAGEVTFNSNGQFVGNGDAEMPNTTNGYPDGWSNSEFGQPAPGAYEYVHAVGANAHLNHTPGGHWSLAVRNPNGVNAWLPPPSGFFDLPTQNDVFNTTISFWVYFTQNGQEARMRLRNNLVPSSINVIAGQAPPAANDNQGGLVNGVVPINQWYEIRKSYPAGTVTDPVGTIEMQIYSFGTNTVDEGTIYFDDLTITRTPVAQVKGKVVTSGGVPVEGAFVGRFVESGVFETPTLFSGPFTQTDAEGNFVLFSATAGPVQVAAWDYPPTTNNVLPDYGYIAVPITTNATADPTPITLTLQAATNVADGATVSATDTGGTRVITGDLADAVDNNLGTRWDQYGGATGLTADQIMTFDLGTAQQVDQVELWWEAAVPEQYRVYVGPDLANMTLIYETPGDASSVNQGIPASFNLTPFADGPVHITDVLDEAKASVRYIRIEAYDFVFGNYSLTELRALSTTAPLPVTLEDAASILRFWGGLSAATPADVARLDQNGSNSLTIEDAVALATSLQ